MNEMVENVDKYMKIRIEMKDLKMWKTSQET
jgi:hypothetical protein